MLEEMNTSHAQFLYSLFLNKISFLVIISFFVEQLLYEIRENYSCSGNIIIVLKQRSIIIRKLR